MTYTNTHTDPPLDEDTANSIAVLAGFVSILEGAQVIASTDLDAFETSGPASQDGNTSKVVATLREIVALIDALEDSFEDVQ